MNLMLNVNDFQCKDKNMTKYYIQKFKYLRNNLLPWDKSTDNIWKQNILELRITSIEKKYEKFSDLLDLTPPPKYVIFYIQNTNLRELASC